MQVLGAGTNRVNTLWNKSPRCSIVNEKEKRYYDKKSL